MASPIHSLHQSISGVPFTVAPEKELECKQVRDQYGIEFEITEEPRFAIRVYLTTNKIMLPVAALEYLWAFSHYCWVLTQEYRLAQESGYAQFDCVGNLRLRESFSLLSWARSNLSEPAKCEWPTNLPAPGSSLLPDDDVAVATELFLCALGWIVHHEIGHIYLRHVDPITLFSVQQESAADNFATDWILSGVEADSDFMLKRSHGIAVAVLCLQSLDTDSEQGGCKTHPNSHDRVFNCLSRYPRDDQERTDAFATVVLQFLFAGHGIKANVDGDSFAEIFSGLLVDFARRPRDSH